MRDLYHNIAAVHLLDAQDVADTDTLSALLDLADFEGACILLNVGALTGVDGSNYLTPVLQECDSTEGDDFTDVAAADILGGFTKIDAATEDQVTQMAGYIGSKRYIRLKLDFTGTAITAGLVSVDGILGYPGKAPATSPGPVNAT